MNKKVLFISLLLLGTQTHKMSSADEDKTFGKAKAELETYFSPEKRVDRFFAEIIPVKDGMYFSQNKDVNELLEMARQQGDKEKSDEEENQSNSYYHTGALEIIKRHYPKAQLEVISFSPDIKPAKRGG